MGFLVSTKKYIEFGNLFKAFTDHFNRIQKQECPGKLQPYLVFWKKFEALDPSFNK